MERSDPADPMGAGPVDILDASGEYIGTLPGGDLGLPAAFGPEGLVVLLVTGDYDVPVARVFRLGAGLEARSRE